MLIVPSRLSARPSSMKIRMRDWFVNWKRKLRDWGNCFGLNLTAVRLEQLGNVLAVFVFSVACVILMFWRVRHYVASFSECCSCCDFQPVESVIVSIVEWLLSVFKFFSTGQCGSWLAVVCIHWELIWHGPICADLQAVDLDLSGSDLAETMCNSEGHNLSAR